MRAEFVPERATFIERSAAVGEAFDIEPIIPADVPAHGHQVDAVLFGERDKGVPGLQAWRKESFVGMKDAVDADGLSKAIQSELGHDSKAAITISGIESFKKRALARVPVVENISTERRDVFAWSGLKIPSIGSDSYGFHGASPAVLTGA